MTRAPTTDGLGCRGCDGMGLGLYPDAEADWLAARETNDPDLTPTEIEWLRAAAGEDVPGLGWGAAATECLETLVGLGLVTRPPVYRATVAGLAWLAAHPATEGKVPPFGRVA